MGLFVSLYPLPDLRKILFILILFLHGQVLQAQHPGGFFTYPDSLNKKRLTLVCAGEGALWLGSMIALNETWYAHYPRSPFHLFNDLGEWKQVDKVGHAWSAYWGTQLSSSLYRWSGLPRKKAAVYGAATGMAYMSVIEILDGFSKKWGFSLGDMTANAGGSLLYAGQTYAWGEQRIEFKFSTHLNRYTSGDLAWRANNLFGASTMERFLKDYNAQTYWLSTNLWSFAKESKLPRWLNIAVGYGADGLFGGFDNVQRDDENQIVLNANGKPAFDRRDIARLRQFYLSPDIDLSKIRIHGKTPRVLLVLNGLKLKFPMPALEWHTQRGLVFHALYF